MTLRRQDNNVYNEIKALSFFQDCSNNFLDVALQQSQILSLEKGQVLFLHEDEITRFFIVTKGWIKLFRETVDGTQVVVDVLTNGGMFGETAIFEDNLCPYSAEAAEKTEVLSLPLFLLKQEIEENPKMAFSMLSSIAHFRQQQYRELEHRTIQNAPQRIGCFLLRLALQQGGGSLFIRLPYDKTLLASRLGIQPETFSRALRKLKDETGIEINGPIIKMKSFDQLAQYSCGACSSNFPCKNI